MEEIKVKKKALSLLLKILCIVVSLWIFTTFVFGIVRVSGINMYPSFKDGDLAIIYRLEDCYKNDVVAYSSPDGTRFGRVIAAEGDTIDGDAEGIILNNGRVVEEVFYSTDMSQVNMELPYTLHKGEFFILNDYREDRSDSRTYGIIKEKDMKGKVIFFFRRRSF